MKRLALDFLRHWLTAINSINFILYVFEKKSTLYFKGMGRGQHQNSLANLRPQRKLYDEEKKKRTLSVTESGWKGVIELVEATGCNSVSEFLEKLGRGEVKIA